MRFRVKDLGSRVYSLSLGFRVKGFGFWGGFGVQGLGLRG
jgi:hypothetical protein